MRSPNSFVLFFWLAFWIKNFLLLLLVSLRWIEKSSSRELITCTTYRKHYTVQTTIWSLKKNAWYETNDVSVMQNAIGPMSLQWALNILGVCYCNFIITTSQMIVVMQREKEGEGVCIYAIYSCVWCFGCAVNLQFRRIGREMGGTMRRTQIVPDFYQTLYNHDHSGYMNLFQKLDFICQKSLNESFLFSFSFRFILYTWCACVRVQFGCIAFFFQTDFGCCYRMFMERKFWQTVVCCQSLFHM